MIFYNPKQIVDYAAFKKRLFRRTALLNLLVAIVLAVIKPACVLHYCAGAMLAYGYLWSLCFTAEYPQRKMAVVLSVMRVT